MKKKLIAITGASTGIGEAAAKVFHQAGYNLLLIARNIKANPSLPNSLFESVDVTDFKGYEAAVQKAEKHFGPLDCLINNAGILTAKDFLQMKPDEHHFMIDVNIKGLVHGLQIALKGMKERKKGTILNISSLGDRQPAAISGVYCATKAAVRNLSESMAKEYGPHGVRITNLAPAFIRTKMWEGSPEWFPHMFENMLTPEEFAKILLWIYELPPHINIRDLVVEPTISPY